MKRGPAPFERQSWRHRGGDIEQPGRLGRPEQLVLILNAPHFGRASRTRPPPGRLALPPFFDMGEHTEGGTGGLVRCSPAGDNRDTAALSRA